MSGNDNDRKLIETMLGPGRAEVGCEECFDLLDRYVDLEIAGENAAEQLPEVAAHFEGCPVCRDEYQSLLSLAGPIGPATGRD